MDFTVPVLNLTEISTYCFRVFVHGSEVNVRQMKAKVCNGIRSKSPDVIKH